MKRARKRSITPLLKEMEAMLKRSKRDLQALMKECLRKGL